MSRVKLKRPKCMVPFGTPTTLLSCLRHQDKCIVHQEKCKRLTHEYVPQKAK